VCLLLYSLKPYSSMVNLYIFTQEVIINKIFMFISRIFYAKVLDSEEISKAVQGCGA
jgi:hypothetical protein